MGQFIFPENDRNVVKAGGLLVSECVSDYPLSSLILKGSVEISRYLDLWQVGGGLRLAQKVVEMIEPVFLALQSEPPLMLKDGICFLPVNSLNTFPTAKC